MGIGKRDRLRREEGAGAVPPSPVIEIDEEDVEKDELPVESVTISEILGDGNRASFEALDVMADMIFRQAKALGWCHSTERSEDWTEEVVTGVSIRSKYGSIRSFQSEHRGLEAFERALIALNARSSIKRRCKAIGVAFKFMM